MSLAASQETGPEHDTRRAALVRRLAEIDQATDKLVRSIEQGVDPAVVQPRLAELRGVRAAGAAKLGTLQEPNRLSSSDIAALLEELGRMETVLAKAKPHDKAAIYASLGLRLTYRPDQRAVLATADLGRVVSRVGGGT